VSQSTTATLCTVRELAKLAGLDVSTFAKHPELLPATTVRTGKSGRPPRVWTTAQLAELIQKRTAGWTDLELRLRAALLDPRPAEAAMVNPFPGYRHIAGSLYLVPNRDGVDHPEDAPEDERPAITAALIHERHLDAERRAAARARSRARHHKSTPA